MSLVHTLKKQIKGYSGASHTTTDAEFDGTYASFKATIVQAEGLQAAFKSNKQVWEAVRKNVRTTLESISGSIAPRESSHQAKGMVGAACDALDVWEDKMKPVLAGESAAASKFNRAERMLADYLRLAADVKVKVGKLEAVRKDLDYYKGKTDSINAQMASKKPLDQSKLARAETNSEQLQGRFDNMNEETFVFMRHAIALSDRVLACAVAAYLELQSTSVRSMGGICDAAQVAQCVTASDWPTPDEFVLETIDTSLSNPSSASKLQGGSSLCSSSSTDSTDSATPPSRPSLPAGYMSADEIARKPCRPAVPAPDSMASSVRPARPPPVNASASVDSVAAAPRPVPARPVLPHSDSVRISSTISPVMQRAPVAEPGSEQPCASPTVARKAMPQKPPKPARLAEDATAGGC